MIIGLYSKLRNPTLKCGVSIFIFIICLSANAHGAGTLAGTDIISSKAELVHNKKVDFSRKVLVKVSQGYGLEVKSPDYIGPLTPGGSFYFPINMTNIGNGSDTYNLVMHNITNGWDAELIKDDNFNGIHEEREKKQVGSPVILSENAELSMFLFLTAPEKARNGSMGKAMLQINGSVTDGGPYLGMNGVYYGGPDVITTKVTAKVINIDTSAPAIADLLINKKTRLPYDVISTKISISANITDNLPNSVEKIVIMINDKIIFEADSKDWKDNYNPYSGKFNLTYPIKEPGIYSLKIIAWDKYGNSSQNTIDPLRVYSPDDVKLFDKPVSDVSPFSPSKGEKFALKYILSTDADITLVFHDLLGRIKWEKTFKAGVENGAKAGENRVSWDGRSRLGEMLKSGIYFFKIVHDDKVLGKGKATILENSKNVDEKS